MLQFCSDYASDNNILFNPNKSQCLKFCKYVNNANLIQFPVSLQGVQLTWTDHIIHLGHHLSATLLDSADMKHRRADFCSQTNYFLSRFNHVIPVVKCKLFQNYCFAFYGSQLWDLQCRCLDDFDVVWRKAVRRIWGLPPRMHSALLPPLMLEHNLRTIINNRFINFAARCLSNNNLKVSFIANVSRVSLLHTFGKNLNFVTAYNNSFVYHPNVKILFELLMARQGLFSINVLSRGEVANLIQDICCN